MMQAVISDLVLVESQSARQGHIEGLLNEEVRGVLDKVKGLLHFVSVGSGEVATTDQMAEFYEVPPETIRTTIKRNLEEFQSDGLKTLRGKALNEVSFIMKLTSQTTNLTLWTPRAALRLGMLLRDSEVAKQVRTVLLDRAEAQPQPSQVKQSFKEEVLDLKAKLLACMELKREDRTLALRLLAAKTGLGEKSVVSMSKTVKASTGNKNRPSMDTLTDVATAFFDDCLIYNENSTETYTSAQLHAFCVQYCSAKNLPRPTLSRMAYVLKQLAPSAYRPRRRVPAHINPSRPLSRAFWQYLQVKPETVLS